MSKPKPDIVKTGGVAKDETETEDVTRDTYGFSEAKHVRAKRDDRIAEAGRAAGRAGVPGVDIPEPGESQQSEEKLRAEAFQRAEVAGNHTASPRDVAKLRHRRRRKP
jgi:hypothetical protein